MIRLPFRTTSPQRVGALYSMKGKGKSKARDREMWGFESDDEFYGRSPPMSAPSSYIEDVPSFTSFSMLKPRNALQEMYLQKLESVDPSIVVATGPAGVAKTYLCTAIGIQKLVKGQIQKLIITRPAVSVDEEHGFLPGTLEEKMDPWLRPIYDVFYKFVNPVKIQSLMAKQQIEICPLAYMRGRTFDNSFIIADEMQNSTCQQMLMLLTRIGKGSKLVITGDPLQHDRGYVQNGLKDLMYRLERDTAGHEKDISFIQFTDEHVERHHVIKKILKLYNTTQMPSN